MKNETFQIFALITEGTCLSLGLSKKKKTNNQNHQESDCN